MNRAKVDEICLFMHSKKWVLFICLDKKKPRKSFGARTKFAEVSNPDTSFLEFSVLREIDEELSKEVFQLLESI